MQCELRVSINFKQKKQSDELNIAVQSMRPCSLNMASYIIAIHYILSILLLPRKFLYILIFFFYFQNRWNLRMYWKVRVELAIFSYNMQKMETKICFGNFWLDWRFVCHIQKMMVATWTNFFSDLYAYNISIFVPFLYIHFD